MTDRLTPQRSIIGNLTVEPVTVNQKGGSLAAILKKSIRGNLGEADFCYGAKMEFDNGMTCVLVAPGASPGADDEPRFYVRRVSPSRFVIDCNVQEDAVDPITQAMLGILDREIKAGTLEVMNEQVARDEIDRLIGEGDQAVAQAKQRAHKLAVP
jgi:hypothetical protein